MATERSTHQQSNERNRKPVSKNTSIDEILFEPMPEDDTDQNQLIAFIRRQYQGYEIVGRKSSLFQFRMGHILRRLRDEIPHGEWGAFIESAFAGDFTIRTATNWMKLAELATEDEASSTAATELMQDKGIIQYRKSRPKNATNNDDNDPDDGMADLKTLGNKVKRIIKCADELKTTTATLPPESYCSADLPPMFVPVSMLVRGCSLLPVEACGA